MTHLQLAVRLAAEFGEWVAMNEPVVVGFDPLRRRYIYQDDRLSFLKLFFARPLASVAVPVA